MATMQASAVMGSRRKTSPAYEPPDRVERTTLLDLNGGARPIPPGQQHLLGIDAGHPEGLQVWIAGDRSLVRRRAVAVVGTRRVSPDGARRARRLAKELAEAGVVVVSGLAEGVDTEALTAAMEAGGDVIAVIGTPLDRAYPAQNKQLQEAIYRDHLLVSQFAPGSQVFPSHFPMRNRTMAALSDATVIIEASDTSGTLHQATECGRLGRWLFIARSVVDDPRLSWPAKFRGGAKTRVLENTSDVLAAIGGGGCRSR